MDEKIQILEPETIAETPFPGQEGDVSFSDSQKTSDGVNSPRTIQDQINPTVKIAHEVISEALNTKTQKVLAEFQFTRYGALQIGEYDVGISGDIRISPNGIVGRNNQGENTFVLDGDTGDAYFKGTIQAGALISGAVAVGDNDIVIDGAQKRMVFYDDAGIPAIVIGNG